MLIVAALSEQELREFTEIAHDLGLDSLIEVHTSEELETAKKNGSWESLDAVEMLEIPDDLNLAFSKNKIALDNYNSFSPLTGKAIYTGSTRRNARKPVKRGSSRY